jgi:hypothetical protein
MTNMTSLAAESAGGRNALEDTEAGVGADEGKTPLPHPQWRHARLVQVRPANCTPSTCSLLPTTGATTTHLSFFFVAHRVALH